MVEAGAGEIPEDKLLEALELRRTRRSRSSARSRRSSHGSVGKPKWLDTSADQGDRGLARQPDPRADPGRGPPRGVGRRRGDLRRAVPRADDGVDRGRHPAPGAGAPEPGHAARVDPARGGREARCAEQFENELRALTDAEQDSKELKSAKRNLLFERIIETVELPFPVGAAAAEGETVVKDTLTKQFVKRAAEAIYKDLVRKKIAVEKRRPDGRGTDEIRPIEHRGRRLAAHARLGALHPRADADHDACSRSAPPRRGSGSTTSPWRPTAATCTTTTSRPTRSGRPASCAARSAATSATARSRSGRSSR